MIPPLPLDHIAPLQLGENFQVVCNGRVVTFKSAAHEAARAQGFTG